MKEIRNAQKPAQPASKRRRVANITPHSNEGGRAGRPTRHETLSKLANEKQDQDVISSKQLILYALDGSEKKEKTVLTCMQQGRHQTSQHETFWLL